MEFVTRVVGDMTSKLPVRRKAEPIAADFDGIVAAHSREQKHQQKQRRPRTSSSSAKKDMKIYSGNFGGSRSRSSDDRRGASTVKNEIDYLKVLIQTKDEQIEKLVEKISDLHNYNDQFSEENDRLRTEISAINENFQALSKNIEEQAEQQKQCERCTELEDIRLQKESWDLEKNNLLKGQAALKEDVEMMKTLVYRLNVQIERYQELLRTRSAADEKDANVHQLETVSVDGDVKHINWGSVSTHTLAPLLKAYQEMLNEKDDLLSQHELELNRFTGQFREVIQENEKLQTEMEELRKSKDSWLEEKTRTQAQLDICRSKAELQTKRADIAKEKLIEVLRCYEQKVQAQSLDLERLQEAYTRAKSELVSLRNLNAQPEAVIESLKECQRLFEELKAQHDNEKSRIAEEFAECKKTLASAEEKVLRLREENANLNSVIARQKHTADSLKRKNTTLQRHLERTKDSRERIKARLNTALHWAKRLEENREKVKNSWHNLRELESLVQRKDAQMRHLQAEYTNEVEKLQRKLQQREETIRTILKDRANAN